MTNHVAIVFPRAVREMARVGRITDVRMDCELSLNIKVYQMTMCCFAITTGKTRKYAGEPYSYQHHYKNSDPGVQTVLD